MWTNDTQRDRNHSQNKQVCPAVNTINRMKTTLLTSFSHALPATCSYDHLLLSLFSNNPPKRVFRLKFMKKGNGTEASEIRLNTSYRDMFSVLPNGASPGWLVCGWCRAMFHQLIMEQHAWPLKKLF